MSEVPFSAPEETDIDPQVALLADHALQGLDASEIAKLGAIRLDGDEALGWQLTAAELDLALDTSIAEELPEHLRLLIKQDVDDYFGAEVRSIGAARSRSRDVIGWLGWVAAAVLLLVNVAMSSNFWPVLSRVTPSVVDKSLQERLAGVPRLRLEASSHPLALGASGDLIWSSERQEGYMDVRGLAEVEPSTGTYQLWIFDETRDERFPVDGGTFQVRDSGSEMIVPIRASLTVHRPTLFAITLEPPDGVVVSDRKRVLLTASVRP